MSRLFALLLQPQETKGQWIWPDLEVKQSRQSSDAGQGVFATRRLRAGTMITIVGVEKTEEQMLALIKADRFTHGYILSDGTILDGQGEHQGLTLWARINEPTRRKPNCIFKLDCVVVAQPIKAGEELTVYYGEDYTRDYPFKNAYLHRDYPHLRAIRVWPSKSQRDTLREKLQARMET